MNETKRELEGDADPTLVVSLCITPIMRTLAGKR